MVATLLLVIVLGIAPSPSASPPVATSPAGSTSSAGELLTPRQQEASTEVLAGIRFHGNYSLADQDLLAAAAIDIGTPLTDATLAALKARLEHYPGVGSVRISKRYRSMTNTRQVTLLILIEEHESPTDKLMFLPVFTWTDEYGITLGARITAIDLLGLGERISVPLTWFGEKQAAAELGFNIERAALTRIDGGFGILRRENPHFEIDDTRVGGWAEATKRWGIFEVAGNVRGANVDFGGRDENQVKFGAQARIDTRQDAVLPRNAFYVGGGWERLHLFESDQEFDRFEVDLRGYKTFVGRTIIASQAYYRGANGALPDWEKPFLGGARTVRGYSAGEFIGDNIALLSVEWRVPLTPPAPVGLVGLNFFFDSGTVYDYGTTLGQSKFYNGVGGGVYFIAAFIGLQVDVAYGFATDEVHVHFSTGFRY